MRRESRRCIHFRARSIRSGLVDCPGDGSGILSRLSWSLSPRRSEDLFEDGDPLAIEKSEELRLVKDSSAAIMLMIAR